MEMLVVRNVIFFEYWIFLPEIINQKNTIYGVYLGTRNSIYQTTKKRKRKDVWNV